MRLKRLLGGMTAMATLGLAFVGGPVQAANSRTIVFGVAAPTSTAFAQSQTDLGRSLPVVREYRNWGDPLFTADDQLVANNGTEFYLSIKSITAQNVNVLFQTVATANPTASGDSLAAYNQIVAYANQVKAWGVPLVLAYNHEPEAARSQKLGSGTDFIAAWRNFVQIFRDQGVTNVKFAWTMTDWSFLRTDAFQATNYWPGADVVDYIGVDAYNFYNCRGFGSWLTFKYALSGVIPFQAAHPTAPIIVAEFSSDEDSTNPARKQKWINDVTAMMATTAYSAVVGMIQWSNPTPLILPNCHFRYDSTPTALSAFQTMAQSPTFANTSPL